jgi:hypothetical protein
MFVKDTIFYHKKRKRKQNAPPSNLTETKQKKQSILLSDYPNRVLMAFSSLGLFSSRYSTNSFT